MNGNNLTSILSWVRLAIIGLGVLLVVIIVMSSVADESFVEGDANYGMYLDWLFYIIYAVGAACAGAAVGFGVYSFVYNLLTDFQSQIGTLAGISVFLVLGLVSYFILADSTVLNAYEASGITVSAGESVFAGGSMIFVYMLGIAAILSVVWAEVSSILKQ
ncbi:MAG: hypothetical protein VX548_01295 [Bacteroidota bacterium]|nr:hypothetical protein [Bacteroidota bacterium]